MRGRGLAFSGGLALVAATAGCPGTLDDPGRFAPGALDDGGGVAGDSGIPGPAATAEGGGSGDDCPNIPQLFESTCTGASCHSASNKAQGLDLQSPDVAARLVNVPATEGAGLLIDPSAPAQSILYLKLSPSPPFGARMPLGATPLDASTLGCVLAWITDGEQVDASSPDEPGDASDDSPGAPPLASDAAVSCQTTTDSYGYTQCACLQGALATSHPVAACTGYDCCVQYGPDSGLAVGFGNPSLSAGLCACYSSADIAAILGASLSCRDFANDGNAMVVSSCQ